MKIVLTSDWHLDHVTDGLSRFGEVWEAVDRSIGVAIEERADLYVFGGDLCDPDGVAVHRCTSAAISAAGRLAKHGIPSLWVAGNHDVVEDGHGTTTLSPLAASSQAGLGLATVAEEPTAFQLGDVFVICLPFTPRSHAYEPEKWIRDLGRKTPAATRKGRVLVVGHLSLEGITPGSETTAMPRGREVTWPTEEIRRWFPEASIFAGHYHRGGDYRGVHIIGALARLTHGEEDNDPSMVVLDL